MYTKSLLHVLLISAIFVCYSNAEGRTLIVPKGVSGFIKAVMKKCTSDEALISSLLKDVSEGKYEESEEFKQLVYCSYINTNFANEDGRFNIEAAAGVFPDDLEFKKALENCDKVGPNPVETNWNSFKCFQDTSSIRIQLV